jgi:hypothetical protein
VAVADAQGNLSEADEDNNDARLVLDVAEGDTQATGQQAVPGMEALMVLAGLAVARYSRVARSR